jgi:hypothetical protein
MLDDIVYDSLFLTVEADKDTSTDPIASYSYDGADYDYTITSSGGETSFVFIT